MNDQKTTARMSPVAGLGERTSLAANVATYTTKDAIENHIRRFREGNLNGVLEDFAPEAVLFTPSGTLRGISEIRTFFQSLLQKFRKPGASEIVHTAIFDGDYGYLIWSGETADNCYEFATDTFVVRNGKIVAQSFGAKITPKR